MIRRCLLVVGILLGVLGTAAAAPAGEGPPNPEMGNVGSANLESAPAESGSSDWRTVDAGTEHTCGIRTSGRLYCWGAGTGGKLGVGGVNEADRMVPTVVAGGFRDWTRVSAGARNTCAIRGSGRLYCWGADDFGQVGDGGTNTARHAPRLVVGGIGPWTAVSVGDRHACARRANGRLFCWGRDSFGELGDSAKLASRSSPVQVAGGRTDWTAVSAGGLRTCARRQSGRLFCWGLEFSNSIGAQPRPRPVQLAGGHTTWAAVSMGDTACARRSGRLYCWLGNEFGQVGDGSQSFRAQPVLVAGGFSNWTQFASSLGVTCGRRATGRLFCWGFDGSGAVGDGGPAADQHTPVQVDGGATDWVSVTVGNNHACARTTTRRLYCWGEDGRGQVGDDLLTADQTTPVDVFAP